MKKYKLPEGTKEIIVLVDGTIAAIKQELVRIRPKEWEIQSFCYPIKEIKND